MYFYVYLCIFFAKDVWAEPSGIDDTLLDYGLVDWVTRGHAGGFFDSQKQQIRKDNDNDRLAIFASERIKKGDVLAKIPWTAMISDDGDEPSGLEEESRFNCAVARNLAHEFRLGPARSNVGPYVEYLLAQPRNIPSTWSQKGKALLVEILGGEESDKKLMDDATNAIEWDWFELCEGPEGYELGIQAALTTIQHSVPPGYLVPIADWYTHRNGKYTNVQAFLEDGEYYEITASRDIEAGEQLHSSFNECGELCAFAVMNDYSTPDFFRDYAFLESMPQTWTIPNGGILLPVEDEDGTPLHRLFPVEPIKFELHQASEGAPIKVFFPGLVWERQFYYGDVLRTHLKYLLRLVNIQYRLELESDIHPKISDWEWEAAWDFHETYVEALTHAVVAMDEMGKVMRGENNHSAECSTFILDMYAEEEEDAFDSDETTSRTCPNNDYLPEHETHYDTFDVEVDDTVYNPQNCASSELIDFADYQTVSSQTNYQPMDWDFREKDRDVCLHLDKILQICTSYRPHYHEWFVHYPARYIEKVKRVIFLGSGDAMNLHEILKYPDLEKVVGLELDQGVTRKSFQFFKTQPHYDDPRVEWWYGDATKTLPLLPRDYWGSFDLLLVDLSETTVSLHVTGKHDILDVVSMLLHPNGLMLENELYIDKMARHFDHTVQIFYGSPKVCTQVHTVSSNGVDFLNSPIYDHGIDTHLFKPTSSNKEADRFRWIHDYLRMTARDQGSCDNSDVDLKLIEQGKQAGILQVIEAENASKDFDNLEKDMYQMLKAQGLNPVTTPSNAKDVVFIVMKEGYIAARMWPEHKYVGFDVYLWGGFDKTHALQPELAEMVGSTSLSQYRVVAGGMHGTNTREKDEDVIGVEFSQKGNCSETDYDKRPALDLAALTVPLEEFLKVLRLDDLVVVVVCGFKDKGSCLAFDALKDKPNIDKIVPLWTCESIVDDLSETLYQNEYDKMIECEIGIESQLQALPMEVDALIFDPTAPLAMWQIMSSILKTPANHAQILGPRYVMVAPFVKNQKRRRRFLDIYRKHQTKTVISVGEYLIHGKGSFLGLKFLMSNVNNPNNSLKQIQNAVRDRLSGPEVVLRAIEGGVLHDPNDLVTERISFPPETYDRSANAKQAAEQRPLGRQSIFQFNLAEGAGKMPPMDKLSGWLQATLGRMGYKLVTRFDVINDVGDGSVIVCQFPEGSALLIWDGEEHVDIHLFSLNQSQEVADKFIKTFVSLTDGILTRAFARADMPRGYGRVVTFAGQATSPFESIEVKSS